MQVKCEKAIIENAASGVTVELSNAFLPAESLYLQVTGTATSVSLQVLGASAASASANDDYVVLSSVNMSSFATSATIATNGIYAFGIDGCRDVKVVLSSVSGGNATVYARTVIGG